jgi:hypothetical protein
MAMLDSTVSALRRPYSELEIDEAQLAAVGFLARYGGRTLDAYRHDLRGFFQWAADVGLPVLEATRPHIDSVFQRPNSALTRSRAVAGVGSNGCRVISSASAM